MMEDQNSTKTVIMAALATLTPPQLSDLTNSISSLFHHHHHRLFSLLTFTPLFSLTLHQLNSMSLHHKSDLIARYLLSILTHLTHFMYTKTSVPSYAATNISLRDLDAVLLLLLLCELHHHDPKALQTTPSKWCPTVCNYYVYDKLLTVSGIGSSKSEVLIKYIELVTKCMRFVRVLDCGRGGEKKVAAAAAVVAALPSVEVSRGGNDCVICKEEMREGRDVCELPCDHLFHWKCILPWLRKRNTCPYCRYRLPTDNVSGEIERLWEVLVKMGIGSNLPIKHLIT